LYSVAIATEKEASKRIKAVDNFFISLFI